MSRDTSGLRRGSPANPWPKGKSANPGGRPKLAQIVLSAGFNPKELRKEVVQIAVAAVRDPDCEPASWRYAHDYLAGILSIRPPKEVVIEDERASVEFDESTMTDEQIDTALTAIEQLKELAVVQEAEPDEPATEH